MSLLPFEKYTVYTSLNPEQIQQQFEQFVELYQPFRKILKVSDKPFNGTIQGQKFTISRNIKYRNSFLPIIKGKITPYQAGSIVDITMSIHPFVIIFTTIWLSIVGMGALSFVLVMISSGKFMIAGLIPMAMLIFGCLLTVIPFKIEAKIAKDFLNDLLLL